MHQCFFGCNLAVAWVLKSIKQRVGGWPSYQSAMASNAVQQTAPHEALIKSPVRSASLDRASPDRCPGKGCVDGCLDQFAGPKMKEEGLPRGLATET